MSTQDKLHSFQDTPHILQVRLLLVSVLLLCNSVVGTPSQESELPPPVEIARVVIDTGESAYTIYVGIPSAATAASLQELEQKVDQERSAELVTWKDFRNNVSSYVGSRVTVDDYPRINVTEGMVEILQRAPSTPIGLTWNGGIAVTAMDYQHAKKTFSVYTADPSEYEPIRDPRRDPVHPMVHFGPLLGWRSPNGPMEVDESLKEGVYVNRTGGFSLTLPQGWKIDQDLRRNSPGTIAALTSPSGEQMLQISPERFTGSLTAYSELTERRMNQLLSDYRKLSESEVTLDGRKAVLVVYQATLGGKLPLKFLTALVPHHGNMMLITATTPEPLFEEAEPVLKKVVLSFEALEDVR